MLACNWSGFKQDGLAKAARSQRKIERTRFPWIFDRFRSRSKSSTATTQMLRKSLSGRKAGRRRFRLHARSILDAPSTRPRPTRESEAKVAAPVPETFCLGLWRPARRSPARWLLRRWAYRPNVLRLRPKGTWIFEARLA